jgi:preprotein translocase subunit SecB
MKKDQSKRDEAPLAPGATLGLLYLKDLSFEAPNVPDVLYGHEQPHLEYTLETTHKLRGKDTFEVILDVAVRARGGDKTLFLVEVKQGGVFQLTGMSSEETWRFLRSRAPEALFPYVRELVASLISRGGFPRVQLKALDFDTLFAAQHPDGRPIRATVQ